MTSNTDLCVTTTLCCALMGSLLAAGLHAAESPPPNPWECRWAVGDITLDGTADESAWTNAQVIDNFALPWLQEDARPAKTATRARLLWDCEHLYFFAEMEDHDLYADVTEHDGLTWRNDVFELFFKPAEEKPGYYEFQVTPAGTVLDMFLPQRGSGGYQRFKSEGTFHVATEIQLDGTLATRSDRDAGWSVEGRIPWRDFLRTGGPPAIEDTWRFALCRYDYSAEFDEPELSTNAPLSKRDFHQHEQYAPLQFVGPAKNTGRSLAPAVAPNLP